MHTRYPWRNETMNCEKCGDNVVCTCMYIGIWGRNVSRGSHYEMDTPN